VKAPSEEEDDCSSHPYTAKFVVEEKTKEKREKNMIK